ncbi:MAG: ABC transporter substrate-binding protein [Rhodocyclaceae bacterium]|nr:ABC transporter substrate-binding protein [Rhodocyclaceae bacterium]
MRALLLLLALWFCAPAQADEPIRIGVSGPFTGGSSPMGVSMLNGIRIAASEINATGGVLGRPIELVERDDEARNELGAQIAQDLIRNERVVAAVGIVNTGVALASQRFYQQARIPIITSVATGSLVTKQFVPPQYPDNYVFRVSANDTLQAEMIVQEAVDRSGFRRVAILHDSTNYGQLGRDDLQVALARRDLKPVVVERFNIGDVDMTAQLRRARAAGAEVLLTYGIGPELAHIANGRVAIDWDVRMVGSWTLSMSNFIDNAGPNAEDARMPQTFISMPVSARVTSFLARYREVTGVERIPVPPAAAQGYDSLLLLAAAIRQAGNTEGHAIREALENLHEKVEGVVTEYYLPFTRGDHEAIKGNHIPFVGRVNQGRVVFAYDEDRQRAARR